MNAVPLNQTGRPRSIGIAFAVLVVYLLLAAVLGNLLPQLVSDDQVAAQFALGHFIPLGIGIVPSSCCSCAGRDGICVIETATANTGIDTKPPAPGRQRRCRSLPPDDRDEPG